MIVVDEVVKTLAAGDEAGVYFVWCLRLAVMK